MPQRVSPSLTPRQVRFLFGRVAILVAESPSSCNEQPLGLSADADCGPPRVTGTLGRGSRPRLVGTRAPRVYSRRDVMSSPLPDDDGERIQAPEKFTAGPAAKGRCTIGVFAVGFVLFGAMWVAFAIQEGSPQWSRMS